MKAIKHIFNLILCVFILVLKMCEFDLTTYIVPRFDTFKKYAHKSFR